MGRTAAVLEVASTSSDRTYRVWVAEDGPIFCDCPAHKFHKGKPAGERPPCKHMRALMQNTPVMTTAQALARTSVAKVAERPRQETVTGTSRFRFLEVQEQDTTGAWVTLSGTDLSRFNNLEV